MKTDMKTKMETISSTSFGSGVSEKRSSVERESDGSNQMESRLALIESRMPMPIVGDSISGEVLLLDTDLRPRWGPGGLPAIEVGDEEHMSLTLIDVAGVLTPQWAYRLLQQ